MFEGVLLFIIIALGVPFFIGYLVGKGSKNKASNGSSDDALRIRGQAELRDYIKFWLKDKPSTIQKNEILKLLGISDWSNNAPPPKPSSASQLANQPSETLFSEARVITQTAAVAVPPSVPTKTKEERDLQNINTILYVASFLLVAAAVLFIGAAVDNSFKFVGAWVVTAGFYISGMVLHAQSKRLRPAAIAFVGTGLALLPFAGLATDIFVLHNPPLSWFITSSIGLVLFLFATLRLQNQVLAYLTLGFVFSLTTSSVAVLQVGFVWYFVLIILVASLLNIIAFFKPKLLPSVFIKPIDDSGQLAVPLAVFGSWWVTSQVPLWQNALVLAAASLHYGVAALAPTKVQYRKLYIFLSRLAASISIVLLAYDWSHNNLLATGLAISVVATVQIALSAAIAKHHRSGYESFWLWSGLAAQLLVILLWSNTDMRAVLTTSSLLLSVFTSFAVAIWLKKSRFALIGVLVGTVLPVQIGKDLLEPNWPNELIAALYIAIAMIFMAVRRLWFHVGGKQQLAIIGYSLYLIIGAAMSLGFERAEWSASYIGVIALIVMAISYLEKSISLQAVANLIFLTAIYIATSLLQIDFIQRIHVTVWLSAAIFYIFRIYFPAVKDQNRAQVMGVYSVLLLLIAGLATVFSDHTVAAALTLLAASVLLIFEARVYKQHEYYEIAAIVATLALQRIIAVNNDFDALLYANWWGVLFYALAWWRRKRGEVPATQFWFALSVLTLLLWALFNLFFYDTALFAALTLLMAGLIFAIEAWATKIHGYYEAAAIITTLALQRLISLNGDFDALLYANWWGAVLYALSWLRRWRRELPAAQAWFVASVSVLMLAALFKIYGEETAFFAAFTLIGVALIFAIEGWVSKKHSYYEAAGIIATAGLQRLFSLSGDYDSLIYTHWWALTIGALAGFRLFISDKQNAQNWLFVSLCVLSIPTGLKALDNPESYQFVFLMEHVVLLVVGGLFSYRPVVLWGASGIGLAVLYWLKDQTYILLGLLGIGLIGFAVWRLLRKKT